jgi:hypothetical protein
MRRGYRVQWRLFLTVGVALIMLLQVVSPAQADMLPEEFLGKFRGSVTGNVGAVEGDFNMVSQAGRDSFLITWPPSRSAVFETSEEKNVFHAEFRGRLIEGAPTFWARLDGRKLIVYTMQIDRHGGYDIYSYIYEPVNDGLDMTVRHLRSGSAPMESKGRLTRYDR